MYTKITKDVGEAVKIIRGGRVVAFPTGTSYGLAVDTLQGHALQRLRNLKQRPSEKTFTVFLKESLWDSFFNLTEQEHALLPAMRGKPLTLLVHPKEDLAHLSQDGRVGVRIIDHPLMQQLADAVGVPLTATSANISGQEACYDLACIQRTFPGRLDPNSTAYGDIGRAGDTTYDLSLGCILDGGTLPKRKATTVARLDGDRVIIVREGELDGTALSGKLPPPLMGSRRRR